MQTLDLGNIDREDIPRGAFPEVSQRFRIRFEKSAFERIRLRGSENQSVEVGGVLVGRFMKDDAGPFLLVESTIDALHADEKGAELTFTHATWEHIHREMDGYPEDLRIVGWYHTHPGFGIFLSDRDQFIHQSFFNLPQQIAVVYDPRTGEHGVFAWQDNEPRRYRQYWIGEQEHLWEGQKAQERPMPRSRQKAEDRSSADPSRVNAPPPEGDQPRGIDWLSYLLIGAFVVICGAIVYMWFMGRGPSRGVMLESPGAMRDRQLTPQAVSVDVEAEILRAMRLLIEGDALWRPMDSGLGRIQNGIRLIEQGEQDEQALRELKDGRDEILRLREAYLGAEAVVRRLEHLAMSRPDRDRAARRELSELRSAVGMLCEELASGAVSASDPARARRLLQVAISVDPGNSKRYQEKLETLRKAQQVPTEGDQD